MLTVPTRIGQSPIHGWGVFAEVDVPKGALLWELTPHLDLNISPEQFDAMPPLAQKFILHYGNRLADHYLLCGDNARFMNHSRTPNLSAHGDSGYALRGIVAGEEITCDYGEFDVTFAATSFG